MKPEIMSLTSCLRRCTVFHLSSPKTLLLLRVTQKKPGTHWGENCPDVNGCNSMVKLASVATETYLKEQTSPTQNMRYKAHTGTQTSGIISIIFSAYIWV